MSHSENDVLAKVGDLLVEINEEYASVQEQEGQLVAIQFGLLAAKAKYLAAHLDILSQLESKPDTTSVSGESASEIIFTPATPKGEEKLDAEKKPDEEVPSNEATDKVEKTPVPEPEAEEPEVVEEEPAIEEPEAEEEEPPVEEPEEEQSTSSSQEEAEPEVAEPKKASADESPISKWRTPAEEKSVEDEVKEEEAVVKSVVEESRTVEVTQSQPAEASVSSGRPLTLNEMIQQQRRAGLTNANQFKTPATKSEQIVDLKTAVSLNDKLLFIKDLFNGYSLAYTEAIELLNRFDNMAEADAFLQANYSLKNNWASKPQTVEKLYTILQKKFG